MFINVDFPDPEGPMIATYSFLSMDNETSSRAKIVSSPMS
jgi:hypothetical protein